jgi:hypothetical protein
MTPTFEYQNRLGRNVSIRVDSDVYLTTKSIDGPTIVEVTGENVNDVMTPEKKLKDVVIKADESGKLYLNGCETPAALIEKGIVG